MTDAELATYAITCTAAVAWAVLAVVETIGAAAVRAVMVMGAGE